jgi:hypothetical protein
MEEKLKLAAKYSRGYLFLALAAAGAAGYFAYSAASLNKLFVILAGSTAILYIIHWLYGAFYWPRAYREGVEKGYISHPFWDLSNYRGHFASLVSVAGFFVLLYLLKPGLEDVLIFIIWAVALALYLSASFFLNRATKTAGLFRSEWLLIDLKELLPDFADRFEKAQPGSDDEYICVDGEWYSRYYTLHFLVPAGAGVLFGLQVSAIRGLIRNMEIAIKEQKKEQQALENLEKEKKENSTEISQEILEQIDRQGDDDE